MLLAIIYISITLIILLIMFCGIGLAITRYFGFKKYDAELTLSTFWLGWSFVIMFLQIWHLFTPVDIKAFIVFSSCSILCLIISKNIVFTLFSSRLAVNVTFLLLFCFIIILIAIMAVGPIISGDSGLYHIPSIRWISSYPIIPGLGNLHGRLAFNSSYFLFNSLIDIGYWSHKSHHLANSLLFLVIFSQIGMSAYKMITNTQAIQAYDIMNIIFIIPIGMLCMQFASSPTPDVPVFLLGIVGSVQLCKLWYSENDFYERAYCVFLIVTISIIGVTIKLNFIFMGLFLSFIAYYKLIIDRGYNKLIKYELLIISVTILILLPWIVRNVILSGYLVYPIPYVSFDVEWKIPYQNVLNEAQWIKSWARHPDLPAAKVLANWDWLSSWTKQIISGRYYLLMVVSPLMMTFIGIIMLLCDKKIKGVLYRYMLFIFPALLSLVFWFLTAPDPRFAGAAFWYIGAGTLAVAYKELSISDLKIVNSLILCLSVAITLLAVLPYRAMLQKGNPGVMSVNGFYPIPSVELQTYRTKSGLIVYTPKKGDACWDAPLPSAPSVNVNLRLREDGNIKSGFMISSRD